jgi:hypothetical protein
MTNEITQAEKKQVLKDTYLTRAAADADLTSGRFKRETATTVTAVLTYPQLPASSPWAQGFDQNVEPPFGVDVEAHEPVGTAKEQEQSSLALNPTTAAASRADVGDRAGEEPVVGAVNLATALAAGSSTKRREW